MSGAHDERHRPILRDLVEQGERAREAFDASELAGCGTCRQELDGMLALIGTLESVGEDERVTIRDAGECADAIREARLRVDFEAQIAGRRESGRAPIRARRDRWLTAAAALLLIGIGGAWLWRRWAAPTPDPRLGDPASELSPSAEVMDFRYFHWNVRLPEGGWFVVRVYDGEAPRPSEELTTSRPIRAQEWLPPPAEIETWGERIRWQLELYNGSSDVPEASWVEEAWLSSPR